MDSTQEHTHDAQQSRAAGCPPALEIDLVHSGSLAPSVEWPTAPPTRRAPSHRPAREPDIVELTTGRAVRLLEAAMTHLGTVLESSQHDQAVRIGQAIATIAQVRDELTHPTR